MRTLWRLCLQNTLLTEAKSRLGSEQRPTPKTSAPLRPIQGSSFNSGLEGSSGGLLEAACGFNFFGRGPKRNIESCIIKYVFSLDLDLDKSQITEVIQYGFSTA